MFVYARYHGLTALVAPTSGTLDRTHAHRLERRLRGRYPLPGLKFWVQSEINTSEIVRWEALREIIANAISRLSR